MRKLLSKSILIKITIPLFALVCIVQGCYIWNDYAHLQLYNTYKYGGISSVQRSGIFVFNLSVVKSIWWLDTYLPKDAPIVLPPRNGIWLTDQNMMQFYLFPRSIWLCNEELSPQCREALANPQSVVLAVNNFPPPEIVIGKVFIPVPEAIRDYRLNGVYIPASMVDPLILSTSEQLYTPSLIPFFVPFIDILILVSLFILGYIFTSLIVTNTSWLDIGILSFPIAIGLLSWSIFITSYLGIPITRGTIFILFFSLATIGTVLNKILRKKWPNPPVVNITRSLRTILLKDRISLVIGTVVVILFGLSTVISIGRGYSLFDDIANWALKGYAIAYQNSIWGGLLRGGHILAYPLNIQISIATFRLFDGDLLPGSKTIFTLLTGSLLVGCYKFWKQLGVSSPISLMGMLILLTTPVFFVYSTLGYANLPFTSYLVLGILWSVEGVFNKKNSSIIIGGLLLAFAAWTRPEGIGFSTLIIISILLTALLFKKIYLNFKQLIAFISPMILFPITWLILLGASQMTQDQIGSTVNSSLQQILQGNFHVPELLSIARYSLSYFTSWRAIGYFGLIFIILGTILFFGSKHKNNNILPVFICLLITFLVPLGMFYFAAFSGIGSYEQFLEVSYDRAMLPAIALLVFLGILIMGSSFSIDNRTID